MQNSHDLITKLYASFNRRDIDHCLELMSEDVDWPKATEGGRVIGKDGIRAYWTRQWAELDPHVEPRQIVEKSEESVAVTVHQLVKSPTGDVIFDGTVWHVYTLRDGLVQRMEVFETQPSAS